MPSGERFRLVLRGVLYDLSPAQFDILKKKSMGIKNPLDWPTTQRVNGLLNKKLVLKRAGKIVPTKLGVEVLKAIEARTKKAQAKET